jgi:hypothetical protein
MPIRSSRRRCSSAGSGDVLDLNRHFHQLARRHHGVRFCYAFVKKALQSVPSLCVLRLDDKRMEIGVGKGVAIILAADGFGEQRVTGGVHGFFTPETAS